MLLLASCCRPRSLPEEAIPTAVMWTGGEGLAASRYGLGSRRAVVMVAVGSSTGGGAAMASSVDHLASPACGTRGGKSVTAMKEAGGEGGWGRSSGVVGSSPPRPRPAPPWPPRRRAPAVLLCVAAAPVGGATCGPRRAEGARHCVRAQHGLEAGYNSWEVVPALSLIDLREQRENGWP